MQNEKAGRCFPVRPCPGWSRMVRLAWC